MWFCCDLFSTQFISNLIFRRFCLSEQKVMDWVCYGNLTSPKIDHSYDITNWCHVSCQLKNYLSVTVWLCDWYFDLSACICIWRKTATWHWCMCPEHLWKLFHKVPWQWKQMASFQASRVYKSCENLIHFCNFGEADIVFSYFLLKEKIKDNHAPANHPSGSAWSGSIFNVDFLQHQNQPVINLVHTFARQFLIRPPGTIEEAHFVTGDQYHGETDFILKLIFHSISHTPNEFIKHFRMALFFVFLVFFFHIKQERFACSGAGLPFPHPASTSSRVPRSVRPSSWMILGGYWGHHCHPKQKWNC